MIVEQAGKTCAEPVEISREVQDGGPAAARRPEGPEHREAESASLRTGAKGLTIPGYDD